MDVQITMPKIYTIVFWFSIILVCVSVFALFAYGLRFGVDFKGGSVLEIEYQNVRPDQNALDAALKGIPSLAISPAGDKGFLIKAGELSEDQHQEMLAKIRGASSGSVFEEKRFDSVGSARRLEVSSSERASLLSAWFCSASLFTSPSFFAKCPGPSLLGRWAWRLSSLFCMMS